MNPKQIALVIIFAAISVSLHPTVSGLAIPSFAPGGRWFQFWEIPIYAACLLFGLRFAVTVAALDTVTVILLLGGGGFTSWFSFIPFVGTLLGVYLIHRFFRKRGSGEQSISIRKETVFSVGSGMLFRFLVGFPAFYVMLKYLIQLPDSAIFTAGAFNLVHDVILVSYSVPLSYLLAELIRNKVRIVI